MRASLPLVAGLLGVVGPLTMAAAPDAAAVLPSIRLTGNPAVDALVVAGVIGPAVAGAGWLLRTGVSASMQAGAAGLDAWADVVEARAKKTQDPSDDGPASAGAAAARAFARALRGASAPKTAPVAAKESEE